MIFSTLIALAVATQELDPDCTDPDFAPQGCPNAELVRAEAALDRQWEWNVADMKARDGRLDRSHDDRPGYVDTLQAAQAAWRTYRDQHCASEGYEARGAAAEPVLIISCKTKLTRQRTEELQALAGESRAK
jgi:uncharacterized protein YecT (DUF1311 family)